MSIPQIFYMFPVAVYKNILADYEKHNVILRDVLQSYIFKSDEDTLTGETIGQTDIHLIPELNEFFEHISSNIRQYLYSLGLKEHLLDIYFTKTWLSIIDQKDLHMRYHNHTSADISYVYYLDVPENSDVISFKNVHKPNDIFPGAFDDGREPEKTLIREYNTSNFNTYHLFPEEGMLVAFPGDLVHGTLANPNADKPFKGRRVAVVGDVSVHLKPGILGLEMGRVPLEVMKKFDNDAFRSI
jgi:Putative 2OG-Fe(II) oxygenase